MPPTDASTTKPSERLLQPAPLRRRRLAGVGRRRARPARGAGRGGSAGRGGRAGRAAAARAAGAALPQPGPGPPRRARTRQPAADIVPTDPHHSLTLPNLKAIFVCLSMATKWTVLDDDGTISVVHKVKYALVAFTETARTQTVPK